MRVVFGCPIFNIQDLKIRKNHELVRQTSKHEVIYIEMIGASVEHAKQIMYREFLKTDADYYFNVDADIFFLNPEIDPIDLLISHNKEVVGGIYVYKKQPLLPAFRPKELQKIYETSGKFPDNYKFMIPENELFEVEWLAGGCMMIKRSIIEQLTKQFLIPNLPMIHKDEYLSEDFAFCKRVRDLGYNIWADSTIKLGHAGTYYFTIENYNKNIDKKI